MKFHKIFIQIIKNCRVKSGLSQEQVAKAIRVPRTSYVQMEANNRKISLQEFERLCKYYGITIEFKPNKLTVLVTLKKVVTF